MITLTRFRRIETILRKQGYAKVIEWSESVHAPQSVEDFAREAIYFICNSGMAVTIGAPIAQRCIARLEEGGSTADVFGHPGKRVAIDDIWRHRAFHFASFQTAQSKLEFLQTLPWIRHGISRAQMKAAEMENDIRIVTERLRLRSWRDGDAEEFDKACNTSNVMRWLNGVQTRSQLKADVRYFVASEARHGFTYWVVERRADDAFLGFCGLVRIPDRDCPIAGELEIG